GVGRIGRRIAGPADIGGARRRTLTLPGGVVEVDAVEHQSPSAADIVGAIEGPDALADDCRRLGAGPVRAAAQRECRELHAGQVSDPTLVVGPLEPYL